MEATVGTGTFGRVRVVFHKRLRRYFALKILKKTELIRLKQVDHIKNEINILSRVEHPFIVNLVGHMQDRECLYMLMEYVPGGELFTYLRDARRLSNDGAKFYAAELALAFEYLHNSLVVYRDLKPENMLLTKQGHLKVADFGFAKVVRDKTFTLCGTPDYLAPEIIQSKGHDVGVDWWAMGVLIYEMLAGYPPFFDENPYAIYQNILSGRVEFPRYFESRARDIIRKLLTADRTRRLGCMRHGAQDVKEHKWFSRIAWSSVLSCSLPPPYVPDLRAENDTRNFEEYPDSDGDDRSRGLTATQQALFADLDGF